MSQEAIVFDTPSGIQYAQLATVKSALKLERTGMKVNRGPKLRKPWALKLGLKSTASYDDVIAEIERRLAELLERQRAGGVP